MSVAARSGRVTVPTWLAALVTIGLLIHACNYLYFFVDDEAIPYVYAQNVLNGKGLSYNSFEGPVEGYSDFLHVGVATGILAAVRLLHLHKLSVFIIGTLGSLACAVGLMFVMVLTFRKLPHIYPSGAVAGLAFLTLAGPLAVWSCSSLETVPFACLIALFTYLLVSHACGAPLTWMPAACATAALLTRVDGFVYIGAILSITLLFAEPSRRKELWIKVVFPSAAIFGTYQVWRLLYFRELLSPPVYAKILFKMRSGANLVTKLPEQNYASAFFGMYGVVPLGLLCTAWIVWKRNRILLTCLVSTALLVAYLAVVGDWMFGFRFFVPVLPLVAILIASSVSAVAARARLAGWALSVACVLWFGNVALAFDRDYERIERHESWLRHPSFDPRRHFSRYYALLEESRHYLHPGDRTAFNQAGFLPFMLDLDNIDDLGICSKFFAKLPTTDISFTEVGRYQPLTAQPVFRAGEAYLLYREPQFLIEPVDLLRAANIGEIPSELLGGFYRLHFVDSSRRHAVYARTMRSVAEFKSQPWRFLENLAHVSHLRRALVNDAPLEPREFGPAFPWLRDRETDVSVGGTYRVDLEFADKDEPIYEVHINQLLADGPLTFVLTLQSRTGGTAYQRILDLQRRQSRDFREHLPEPVRASRLRIEIAGVPYRRTWLKIRDLRIQGQTAALRDYIANTLRFPAS